MKIMTQEAAAQPTAAEKLREIQEKLQEVTEPHYHEFYKVVNERGFTKITIPRKR